MKPKPYNGGRWTTARFWGFLRSSLRSASVRWGPIQDARKAARRAYSGPNARQKWEYQCAGCGRWFKGTDCQVDHVEPVGALKDWADLPGFCQRLFCEVNGLRVLCSSCHEKRRGK